MTSLASVLLLTLDDYGLIPANINNQILRHGVAHKLESKCWFLSVKYFLKLCLFGNASTIIHFVISAESRYDVKLSVELLDIFHIAK